MSTTFSSEYADMERWKCHSYVYPSVNLLLSCECLVTTRLDWIMNLTEVWQTCAEVETQVFGAATYSISESTAVDYALPAEICIPPGEVLYLKWTFHPPVKGSSARMAIGDLSVGFNVLGQGLVLTIANARTHGNVPVVLCPLS